MKDYTAELVKGTRATWVTRAEDVYPSISGAQPIGQRLRLYGTVVRSEAECAMTGTPGEVWVREGLEGYGRQTGGATFAIHAGDVVPIKPWSVHRSQPGG